MEYTTTNAAYAADVGSLSSKTGATDGWTLSG